MRQVSNVAHAKGLGTIEVSGPESEWTDPTSTAAHVHVQDVVGQLNYRLQRRGSAGEIAGMVLSQPINFLAPTLVLKNGDPS